MQHSARPDVHAPLRDRLPAAEAFRSDGTPNVEAIQNHLMREGRLHGDVARQLIAGCERLLRREPNLLTLSAPVTVCGDIHGQYYDLIALFNHNGYPTRENPYLFLGDYVDRGYFGTEVCFLLFAMKVCHLPAPALRPAHRSHQTSCATLSRYSCCVATTNVEP